MRTKEQDKALISVMDPLFQVACNYVNKMRSGELPVDMESWILVKRALLAGFEIPDGVLPDNPIDLTEPLQVGNPTTPADRIS